MREFKTFTKDSKTGYEMILSECSYNMAMDWLENKIKELGHTPNIECKKEGDLMVITTSGRTFFYDEERGYLLGE